MDCNKPGLHVPVFFFSWIQRGSEAAYYIVETQQSGDAKIPF
ncbi:hypothetical protein ACI48J_02480 [Paenibacillus chitinolyticus]|nr:hypothetical protein [Paenibacillus chitinolyticus]MEC0246228.1 hypothetical protein [Paenibacillus chitinolyticus]